MKRASEKGSTHDRKFHARPQKRARPQATTEEQYRVLALARKIVIKCNMRTVWPVMNP